MNKKTIKGILSKAVLVAFIVIGADHVLFANARAWFNLGVLVKGNFLYENIRKTMTFSGLGAEAGRILPSDARVAIFPDRWTLPKIAVRYQIYPIKMSRNATHIIDRDGLLHDVPPSWASRKLGSRAVIYAMPGHGFLQTPRQERPVDYFLSSFYSVLFVMVNVLFGGLLLNLFGLRFKDAGKAWYLSTSYLLGFLLLTASVWLHLLMGGYLQVLQVTALWSLVLALLVFLNLKRKRRRLYSPVPCVKEKLSRREKFYARLSFLLACLVVFCVFFRASAVPVSDWDGMSHWIIKSKVFFHEQGLVLKGTHHNYYPVLWPLNIAVQFMFLGRMLDQMASWTTAWLFVAFIIQVAKGLQMMGVNRLWLFVLLAFYPAVLYHDPRNDFWKLNLVWPNAENVFLGYLTASIIFLVAYLENHQEKSNLILAAVMLLGLSLAKFEGSIAVACISIPFIIFAHKREEGFKNKALLYALPTVVIFYALWLLWVKSHGYLGYVIHMQKSFTFEKTWILIKAAFEHLSVINISIISLCAVLFYALIPYRAPWRDSEKFLLVTAALLFLFAAFAHLGLPGRILKTGMEDSFPRLLIHATPPFLLWWASRVLRTQTGREAKN